jgi:hypothetical protein
MGDRFLTSHHSDDSLGIGNTDLTPGQRVRISNTWMSSMSGACDQAGCKLTMAGAQARSVKAFRTRGEIMMMVGYRLVELMVDMYEHKN